MSSVFKHSDPDFLACKNHSKSFKDVLFGSDTSVDFPDLKVTTLRGLSTLWISEEEVLHLAKLFDYALVGKFSLRRPVLDSIRNFFSTSNCRLSNDLDYGRSFVHRSYFVYCCFMMLIKWTPFLDLSEEPLIVPVWIPIWNLCLADRFILIMPLLWVLGRPLCILVEMDISRSYPDFV
ncbi:hypothetical protein IEQ34_005385 [Dendrobium chrysotoxum]|uniref:DUF4283 domain-containing protein n=1 Tax=Dendrobium chrysotoxum TaxID=161865 RepID=A0AAV7H8E0_DENCH|nr:hypothetical protein IEQ34_005385 [Dendrobium chrysotoxum]